MTNNERPMTNENDTPPAESNAGYTALARADTLTNTPREISLEQLASGTKPNSPDGQSQKESPGEALVRMASSARRFRGSDGRYYASVPVNGHLECDEIESPGF